MKDMKIYKFLVLFAYIAVLFTLPALGAETVASAKKVFRFQARTWDALSSSTGQLNGEYDVAISDGRCKVTHEIDGKSYLVEGGSAAELCRMVGIDPDKRKYINPPHKVGQMWPQPHSYRIPRLPNMEFQRTVTYSVVGKEKLPTPAGTFETFKIEGSFHGTSQWTGDFEQKWVYNYDEAANIIVKWKYDSSVGTKGAKVEIELIKFSSD